MDFYLRVFELINFQSFSNLWFWIMLAVFWSTMSHYVMGVPYDMVVRAARSGGQAERDMMDMIRLNANRLIYLMEVSGIWVIGFACFVLSTLAVLGWGFGIEFCQAIFALAAPLTAIFFLSVSSAHNISRDDPEAARKRLRRQRLYTQILGLLSILLTSMWGMFVNLTTQGFAF